MRIGHTINVEAFSVSLCYIKYVYHHSFMHIYSFNNECHYNIIFSIFQHHVHKLVEQQALNKIATNMSYQKLIILGKQGKPQSPIILK